MPGRRLGSSSDARGVLTKLGRRTAPSPRAAGPRAPGPRRDRAAAGAESGGSIHVRKPHDEPVVAPQRFDVDAGLLADPGGGRHRPRRVNASAARRQHADAPVARARRARARRRSSPRRERARAAAMLIAQVLQQVLGGAPIEVVLARQPIDGGRGPAAAAGRASGVRWRGRARAAVPRGRPSRTASCPAAPGAGETSTRSWVISSMRHDEAPSTNVSPAWLSKTISSSSSPTARGAGRRADEKDAVEPAIRNRAAVGDGHALRALARRDGAGDAIPGDARPQLGELVGRIASRQHVEHAVEHGAAQLRERRRRRMAANRSSTSHSSIEVIATICCATMSSGLRG